MTRQIQWETDWDRALERSRVENKLILLDFFNPN